MRENFLLHALLDKMEDDGLERQLRYILGGGGGEIGSQNFRRIEDGTEEVDPDKVPTFRCRSFQLDSPLASNPHSQDPSRQPLAWFHPVRTYGLPQIDNVDY